MSSEQEITIRRNWLSIPMRPQTSSSGSPSRKKANGANCGALPTEPTMTLSSTWNSLSRICPTSIRRRTRSMYRTLSSRRSVLTVSLSQSSAPRMTKKRSSTATKRMFVQLCTSIRSLLRSRSVSSRCLQNSVRKPSRSSVSFLRSICANSMTDSPSVSAIEDRTRSELRTASFMTSIPKKITA